MEERWYQRRLVRWSITAVIVLVIGALFVQREVLSGGGDEEFGLLDSQRVAVGDPAPDLLLRRLDGAPVRLSDYRGKTVVLNFWASWCGPCRSEMPEFEDLWTQRGEDGTDDLVILAVNATAEDSESAVVDFVDEFGLTFPVLFDTSEGAVVGRFGVPGLPATFFIDDEGVLRAMNLGPVFGNLLTDLLAQTEGNET